LARIVSLLPAATEIVCALGAGDQLVGVSHECDYPPFVRRLPSVTATAIDGTRSSREIDASVRAIRADGRRVIGMDAGQIRDLAPDIMLTQDLCEVCAVVDGDACRLTTILEPAPRLVSLAARDVAGIWKDVEIVGAALDRAPAAASLVAGLQQRLAGLAGSPPPVRPRVVCIEWLDPLYLAGHWVPELIRAAGGEDIMAVSGSHSVVADWENVAVLDPDVVIIALCGFGIERAFKELDRLDDNHWLRAAACPVWVLDGNAFTSRPGPRVVEGAQLIRDALLGV
jgi:iron complex transport system substrate-binding protein